MVFLNFIFQLFIGIIENTINFCIMTLFAAALLNELFTSGSFCVESLGFSTCPIMFSMNNDSISSLLNK